MSTRSARFSRARRALAGIFVLAAVARILSAEFAVDVLRPPSDLENLAGPPPHAMWSLTFSEEFNGSELDEKTWAWEHGTRHTHIASTRWRENIDVNNGVCYLMALQESRAGRDWTTASIWTRNFTQTYGYFEARYRYASAAGLNNAFWLMTDRTRQQDQHFEIDINEGHFPNSVHTSLHNHSGEHWARGRRIQIGHQTTDLSADFHVYGLEWSQHELVWYVDGKEIRRLPHTICHGPAHIRLSTAVFSNNWAGIATEALHEKSMIVDYVRAYRRTGANREG